MSTPPPFHVLGPDGGPAGWGQALREAPAAFARDVGLPSVVAGFVAVLVGYSSSVAIVFQAARAFGASAAQITSWMVALGLAMAISSVALSVRWRLPVLTAWSTPGAALLAASQGVPLAQAVGAFLLAAALTVLVGATGLFERLMGRLPMAVASALLAGVLARFGLDAVLAARGAPVLVLAMAGAYLAGRRLAPRYAVPMVLLTGCLVASVQGDLHAVPTLLEPPRLVFVAPEFELSVLLGLGLPLFLVTMASQNLPGVAAQRAAGFEVPVSPVITATGLTALVLAPFGGYAINLAAITAAICMSPEAHPDPRRRWTAPVMAGLFYALLGLGGAAVAGLLAAFPPALVAGVAGLALVGTIAAALGAALAVERQRDAALITFLVTLSGIAPFGLGSAFWGAVAGTLALLAAPKEKKRS